MTGLTIKEAYLLGREHLVAAGSPEPAAEAELLLRFVLGVDRARLYTYWDGPMPDASWTRYAAVLDERAEGRPAHYIVGEREFMGLSFVVDERVMIPRPETELLVDLVLTRLRRSAASIIVDVGTGSGGIAVSLARALPGARVYATDLSAGALEVAGGNARRHGVAERITFVHGDLLAPLPSGLHGVVDAMLSNPPYVPEEQAAALPREIRDHEPRTAIVAPGDGLGHHRALVSGAPAWLAPGGLLAMEVGRGQAAVLMQILEASREFGRSGVVSDGAGIGRVVWGEAEK